MEKYISPEGEEFIAEEVSSADRILNEGVPFIIVDIKEKRLSIKEGDLFLYANVQGNVDSENTSGLGLYFGDTRFLSCWEMYLGGRTPILLSTSAQRDYMAHIELTNADITENQSLKVPQETINIRRLRIIDENNLMERIRLKNYNSFPVELNIQLVFCADFADIFEVRGLRQLKRGQLFKPKLVGKNLTLAYLGRDKVFRQTVISMSEVPNQLELVHNKAVVTYKVQIEPHGRELLHFYIQPQLGAKKKPLPNFNFTISRLRRNYNQWINSCTNFYTDNELFNSVLDRGKNDIRALLTNLKEGQIISAGIPWYVAPFGRDSLIASLQTMVLNTSPARSSLSTLSKLQGRAVVPWRDEEPGKIMHEFRSGELAKLGEIPHTPYYGTVDATPLYLLVISEYYKWTGDLAFIKKHQKSLLAALAWIDNYGDKDGDGFVEYLRRSKRGLINQGWKDSYNAVAHANGEMASGPIALVEVQAYVYYAKKRMSRVFSDLGNKDLAKKLAREAEELREKFNQWFWMEDKQYYAMALDGKKNQVRSITSNPGQCLWSGIVDEDKAEKVMRHLMAPDLFSGWGIRTVSKSAKIYNPMSYHNGSVWPHDNGIIVRGLKRYGFKEQAEIVATGMFEAAIHYPYYRLPELFCGFTRRGNNWPVEYPVACSPQAWAAGSMFMILQSILGLTPDAPSNVLYVNNPTLPEWLNQVTISNLRIGQAVITITFSRQQGVTSFTVPKKQGKIRIVMEE
jgi:glycogen debranching enzyme